MDVTKNNFVQLLPEIESKINDCDVVAIDCEFTGLFTVKSNNYLDTHEQYYQKCRNNIGQFQIIQIGLSLFKRLADDEFDCDCYNFYIFPSTCYLLPRQEKERYFLCQSSSLSFLMKNNFDFNKWIREGISYVNLSQEKIIQENMEKVDKEYIQIISKSDQEFVDDIMKQITDFVQSNDNQELVLPQTNAFRRRLIYEAVEKSEYKLQLTLSLHSSDKMRISITKNSPETKNEKEKLALQEMVGFTEVIKSLVKYGKPLVGHNLYLDLLYIYHTFVSPLPDSYVEFKNSLHALFPTIYDTRYISSCGLLDQLLSQKDLGNLYKALSQNPFLKTTFHLKTGDNNDERCHEAGYDSYITGCSYIALVRYLCAQEFTKVDNCLVNDIVAKYRNKVGILCSYDLKYMNLEAEDVPPSRFHVFHITFPKDWRNHQIFALFVDYGGLSNITYIDDTSAFCILKEKDNAAQVIKKLARKRSNVYKVQLYSDFMNAKPCDEQYHSSENEDNNDDDDEKDGISPNTKKTKLDTSVQSINQCDKSDETPSETETKNGKRKLSSKSSTTSKLFEEPEWS